MSRAARVRNIILGILMIVVAILFIASPENSYEVISVVLCMGLLAVGFRYLFFYLGMARFMVSGRSILYLSVIFIDLGLFAITMSDVPKSLVFIYLLIAYAFTGAVDILRAFEARSFGNPAWKLKLIAGCMNLLIAVLCIVFIRSLAAVVYIYSAGLIYLALVRIVSACRRTAIAYIP